MQKYVLVKFLEKLPEGTEFSASNWPLHVTLTPRFAVDWEGNNLFEKLSALLADQKLVTAQAADDDWFGPQLQIQVTTLNMNAKLQSLHNDVVGLLEKLGASFDEPQYMGAGYRAHATVQQNARLHRGDQVTIDELTIVDMFPRGDINRRKVLSTIEFLG